jgi:transposase
MSTRRLARDEIGKRGLDIYETQLRSKLAAVALDQFVAVDVETAEYEVADEAHLASQRLRTRLPNAQIFIARVGHRAAFLAR